MLEMMLKSINKKKNNQKGFTLVELIVVIAILGILAAVAVGRFGGFTDKAKLNADYATAATIASAAEVYYTEEGFDSSKKVSDINTAGYLDKGAYASQSGTGNLDIIATQDATTKVITIEVRDNGGNTSGTKFYPN